VRFRVRHDQMRSVVRVEHGSASCDQALCCSRHSGPSFCKRAVFSGHAHIHVKPILRCFGLRYLDQGQARPYACRIAKPGGVPLALSWIEIERVEPFCAGGERRRWRFVDVAEREFPELGERCWVRAVEREVNSNRHTSIVPAAAGLPSPRRSASTRAGSPAGREPARECGGGVFDVVEPAAGSERAGDFGDGLISVVL
jgi:hypothetical protein